MSKLQAKIDRVLNVNCETMHERWLMNRSLLAVVTDSHNLREFAKIRCSHTGKPLGSYSAAYLGELQRVHGVERAQFVLKMMATKQEQGFMKYNVAGETLSEFLIQEPVAFFMHALAEYGGWYHGTLPSDIIERTESVWATIQQRGRVYDALVSSLASKEENSLHMRSLLHACELLRRYLAIAFKHKQEESMDSIVERLDAHSTILDADMQDIIASIHHSLSALILSVRNQRKEIKNATNLISEVRNKYGAGGGMWRQQGKGDKYFSLDEASRVLLEALDVNIIPELSPLDALTTSNRIRREKERQKEERQKEEKQYEGRARTSEAGELETITIKWHGE